MAGAEGGGGCAQSRKFMHFDGGILVNGGKRRVSRRARSRGKVFAHRQTRSYRESPRFRFSSNSNK